MLRDVAPWVFVLLLTPAALFAQTGEKPTSCQQTAKRVLEPYEQGLARAEAAAKEYEEKNSARIESIQSAIELRRSLRERFDAFREKDRAYFDGRIEAAREAQATARERAQKRLAELQEALGAAEAKKRESEAKRLRDAIARLRKDLASGSVSAHSKKLGWGGSIQGWAKFIQDESQRKQKRLAEHAAGKAPMHVKELGYGLGWQTVLDEIAKKQKELAEAKARKPGYHLKPLGFGLSGEGIDDYVTKKRAELADARNRIAAGTYRLHVRTLGYTTDRNGVQKLIHEAKERYRKTYAAWAAKTYRTHNPLIGYSPSNGDLEKRLAKERKELAEYQAAGMDAVAWASGRGQKGSDIQKALAQASRDRNQRSIAYHQKVLAEWRKNRAIHIAKLKERIATTQKILKKHQELWREDLKKQKEHIDGRLMRALGETPCGGGATGVRDPKADAVDREVDKINRMSESDEERRRRLDDYWDRIYREPDGTIHGDPKDAWRNALRDLPVGDGQMSMPEYVLWLKNHLDWLVGFVDAGKLTAFTLELESIIKEFEALNPRGMSSKEFFKQRKALRAKLKGIEEALEGGFLSPSRIQRYIDTLVKGGSGSRKTRDQLKQMRQLLRHSQDAKRMLTSWSAIKSVASNLKGQALTAYQSFVKGSADDVAKRLDGALGSMSKFEKGLLVMSIASAAADAYSQTQKGVAPSEAIARASTDFVIDMIIGGVPILAAAEMGTQILFTSYAMATGDQGVSDATLSNTAKWAARNVLDQVAAGAAGLGRWSIALERFASGEPGVAEILANVDHEKLRMALSRVEERIASLPPGHEDEARLMRARQAFRKLLRAK